MNIIPIEQLYHYNYNINVINSLKQYWEKYNICNFLGRPKSQNMLLYLDGCKARYTLPDDSCFTVESGSIVYLPIGCEYIVEFYDFETEQSGTIGINFFLYDKNNLPFILSNQIIFFESPPLDCKALIYKIDSFSEIPLPCYGYMRSGMYDLLTSLSNNFRKNDLTKFRIISKGISYIEDTAEQSISIHEIATLCNVSEVYFRKLFKEYAGMSPMEYRIKNKISKAKNYLNYSDLNVAEISDLLNFSDVSFFCKQFKKYTGVTPSQYKKGY